MTSQQIAANAACYQCMDDNQKKAAIVYLLDAIAANGTGGGGSGTFVLKAGDTMTGQLVLPSANYTTQAVTPGTPASGFVAFANASGKRSYKMSDGFVRTYDSTLTANRTWTTPDSDLTFAGINIAQTFSALQTFSANAELRNGATANSLDIYNTYSGGGANYERLRIDFGVTTANEVTIANNILGTGVARNMNVTSQSVLALTAASQVTIQAGTGSAVQFRTNGNTNRCNISSTGNFLFNNDNVNSIGASLANRPAAIFVGATGITVGSTTLLTTSVALTNGAAAAAGTLGNAPVAGNPTKWVPINDNGTTRFIPAW